jgi:lipoyl(octanoyl) transferase
MQEIRIKTLGRRDYESVWHQMKEFTETRQDHLDELWLVEHLPVFTQGLAGKEEHILNPADIPVVKVDRGGQVTYHGPGQLVAYPLINIKRANMGVRDLVTALESSVIEMLEQYNIEASLKAGAPGVYVGSEKIASLGLKIRKGCSFHGMALNVNMDLTPFSAINPCGYANMKMTQCVELNGPKTTEEAATAWLPIFCKKMGMSINQTET